MEATTKRQSIETEFGSDSILVLDNAISAQEAEGITKHALSHPGKAFSHAALGKAIYARIRSHLPWKHDAKSDLPKGIRSAFGVSDPTEWSAREMPAPESQDVVLCMWTSSDSEGGAIQLRHPKAAATADPITIEPKAGRIVVYYHKLERKHEPVTKGAITVLEGTVDYSTA